MPVPATNDEFLDLVRKSGVADDAKLEAYLEKIKSGSTPIPPQPNKFAVWLVRDGLITYFQAEQILQGKYKKFFIGKYKVLEKLGAGGMGQVFLCEHKMMRRRVAVKVLPIAKSDDDSARERFYREARAVASLDHPNIVRAYDVDQDENLHFLVMEYVDGTNLHDLVKKHKVLDVDRACHYIYAAAAGLQYANSMGIIHRDIKPANLLVDRAGIVKVLDMGLARFFKDEDESLTRKFDENVLGTADYLAPEQAIDSHTVDIRADIYSLGGTFYYLLTGSVPFPDGSIAQKLMMHQARDPKAISLIRPEVPEAVTAIVEKMMKKEPKDRYTTPAELMVDLAPLVQSPIPPPTIAEMPKLSRAALGGATQMSSIGRAQQSGILLTQSSGSGIPFAGVGSGGILAQASAIITSPKAMPAAIWEDIAAETTSATTADTAPEKSKKPLPQATPEAVPPQRRKWLLVGGVAAVLLLATAAILIFKSGGRGSNPQASSSAPVEPPGPRTLYVTKSTSQTPDTTFTTLREAIEKVKPGDRILIIDDPHEEPPLRIALGPGRLKDVTIEAGNPAKMVMFKLPPGSITESKRGFLEIASSDGLKLRNLSFDAGGKTDYCIKLSGPIDGLLLENIILTGATSANLFAEKTVAAPESPARFNKVLLRVDRRNSDGIQFLGDARTTVSNILVENCRFIGQGFNAVHFRGPARDIELRNNRVYHFDYAVQFSGTENTCQVRIVGNTFQDISIAGIWTNGQPPANPRPEIVLERNYFGKTSAILRGPNNTVPGLKASDNARDKDSKPGNQGLDPKAGEVQNFTLPDPAGDDDANFLRIDDKGPLGAFGPNKVKVGAR